MTAPRHRAMDHSTSYPTTVYPSTSYPSAAYPVVQRLLRPVRRGAAREDRLTDRAAVAGPHLAFLAGHLTARDRWLARVVAEHRVFTSTQLAQLAFVSESTATRRLLRLYEWRVLDRFQPVLAAGSAPMHYVLDLAGAAVLAAEDGVDSLDGYRHDRALAIGHSLRLAHTVGVNGLYAALVAVARHSASRSDTDTDGRGGRAVTAWWPETRTARLWGDLVRPDAYVRWRENDAEIDGFLEYDTGTESLAKVAGKLHDYARLAAATGITTPVLFWFPTPAREANARAALAATLTTLDRPATVPVATASAAPPSGRGRCDQTMLVPDSPAAPRWLPLAPGRPNTPADSGVRVRLARLTWPGLDRHPVGGAAPFTSSEVVGPSRMPGLIEPDPMPPTEPSANTRPATARPAADDPRRLS